MAFLACPCVGWAAETHDVTTRAIHLCEWQANSLLGEEELKPALVPILQLQGASPVAPEDAAEANRVAATVMLSELSREYSDGPTGWNKTFDAWMKSNLLGLRSELKNDMDWLKLNPSTNDAEPYGQHMLWLNEQKTRAIVLKKSLLEDGPPYECTIVGVTIDDVESALGYSSSELAAQTYASWTIRELSLNAPYGVVDIRLYEFHPEAQIPTFAQRMLKISFTYPN